MVKKHEAVGNLVFPHSDLPFAEHLMMVPIFSIHHLPFNDGLTLVPQFLATQYYPDDRSGFIHYHFYIKS